MSDVVISVRGEASSVVAPDVALLACHVQTRAPDKAPALAAAAGDLRTVEAALASLGGVVATSESRRVPLSWAASSVHTQEESYWDRHTEQQRPTGQIVATVDVQVRVRDLDLLSQVGDALAGQQSLQLGHVGWVVDDDNPAWPRVRADAIRTALQRARDYAAALGGSVTTVSQIADSGLLSHGGEQQSASMR
ncbi:MAG TPA: SIMPL domain-containing protein, partial [Jatrophihabitans sp.]